MRNKLDEKIEAGRIFIPGYDTKSGVIWGAFAVLGPCGRVLRIISDDGRAPEITTNWEHVSVSTETRKPPNWEEMNWVKDQFWDEEETVIQFHPKKSEYKNFHPGCLHLWREIGVDYPLPPRKLV